MTTTASVQQVHVPQQRRGRMHTRTGSAIKNAAISCATTRMSIMAETQTMHWMFLSTTTTPGTVDEDTGSTFATTETTITKKHQHPRPILPTTTTTTTVISQVMPIQHQKDEEKEEGKQEVIHNKDRNENVLCGTTAASTITLASSSNSTTSSTSNNMNNNSTNNSTNNNLLETIATKLGIMKYYNELGMPFIVWWYSVWMVTGISIYGVIEYNGYDIVQILEEYSSAADAALDTTTSSSWYYYVPPILQEYLDPTRIQHFLEEHNIVSQLQPLNDAIDDTTSIIYDNNKQNSVNIMTAILVNKCLEPIRFPFVLYTSKPIIQWWRNEQQRRTLNKEDRTTKNDRRGRIINNKPTQNIETYLRQRNNKQ